MVSAMRKETCCRSAGSARAPVSTSARMGIAVFIMPLLRLGLHLSGGLLRGAGGSVHTFFRAFRHTLAGMFGTLAGGFAGLFCTLPCLFHLIFGRVLCKRRNRKQRKCDNRSSELHAHQLRAILGPYQVGESLRKA